MTEKTITLSRPKDRSLESFKLWVNEIADRMVGKGQGGDVSDAEWTAAWTGFWKSADKEN